MMPQLLSMVVESILSNIFPILFAPTLAIVLQFFIASHTHDTNQRHAKTQKHATQHSSSLHYRRRIQHASSGLLFFALSHMIPTPVARASLCITSVLFYLLHVARSSSITVQEYFLKHFGPLLRNYEKNVDTLPAAFWFLFGTTVVMVCFPLDIARTSILCLSLGDPAAAIVGIQVGGPKICGTNRMGGGDKKRNQCAKGGSKSISGSLACFSICYLMGRICMKDYGPNIWFLVGITATWMEMLESFCPGFVTVDDNFLIPVGTGVVLWFATTNFAV